MSGSITTVPRRRGRRQPSLAPAGTGVAAVVSGRVDPALVYHHRAGFFRKHCSKSVCPRRRTRTAAGAAAACASRGCVGLGGGGGGSGGRCGCVCDCILIIIGIIDAKDGHAAVRIGARIEGERVRHAGVPPLKHPSPPVRQTLHLAPAALLHRHTARHTTFLPSGILVLRCSARFTPGQASLEGTLCSSLRGVSHVENLQITWMAGTTTAAATVGTVRIIIVRGKICALPSISAHALCRHCQASREDDVARPAGSGEVAGR